MVIGQLYGHAHTDFFHLTKDNGAIFINPSLTVNTPQQNPGMGRRYVYDDLTYNLKYYQQYYTDLQEANDKKQLTWKLLYQTNDDPYKITDLSLPGMRDFSRRL